MAVLTGFDLFEFGTDATAPYLRNRNPASGEPNVSRTSTIYLEIVDTDSDVDETTIIINIDPGTGLVTAYDAGAGGWQGAWTGSVVEDTEGGRKYYKVTINPFGGAWDWAASVTVGVVAADTSANVLSTSYSFTVEEDITIPIIKNEAPFPGETGVLAATNIYFEVEDPETGINLTTLTAYVNGTLAYENATGGFKTGFSGSVVDGGGGLLYQVTINPDALLPSGATTDIRVVVSNNNPTPGTLDTTYSFDVVAITAPILQNQNPAPDVTGISAGTNIYFEISDPEDDVDTSTIEAYVDGVLAYDSTGFKPDYDGPGSNFVSAGGGLYQITIDPVNPLPNGIYVPIRVKADNLAVPVGSLDETYSFRVVVSTVPILQNQNPAPGQTGVFNNSNIYFEIYDPEDDVDPATIVAYVSGTLAYDGTGSGFQTGYDGPASDVTNAGGGVYQVTIDPTGFLPSGTDVLIRVRADNLAVPPGSMDDRYTFTTGSIPFLTDEDPEPLDIASIFTNVAFTINDAAQQVSQATIEVRIDGTLVYDGDGGGFQTGFQGDESSIKTNGLGFDVVIDPETDFTVDTTVSVNVVASNVGGHSMDETYTFDTLASSLQVVARYVEPSDLVQVDVYLYEETSQIIRGNYIDTGSVVLMSRDNELQTIDFSGSHSDAEGIVHCYFVHPAETYDLTAAVELTTVNPVTLNLTVDVLTEEPKSIPFTTNLSKGTAEHQPRTLHESSGVLSQEIRQAPYEVAVQDPVITNELLEIDFTVAYDYWVEGTGPLDYSGGGHRLLPLIETPTEFVQQNPDAFSNNLKARQLVEEESANKITNSRFLDSTADVPDDFEWESNDYIIVQNELGDYVEGVAKYLKTTLTGLKPEYTGDVVARLDCTQAITIDPADPVTLSVLTKTGRRDTGTRVAKLTLAVEFYNGSTLLSTRSVEYDPETLELDDFALIELVTEAVNVPGTADNIRWYLTLGSIDGGDEMSVYLTCPQVEAKAFSTSRITGDRTRQADDLSVPQTDNIELEQGRFVVTFAPGYDDVPPHAAVLFDTRDPASAWKGFTAQHRADGYLQFDIVDDSGGTTTAVSTAAHSLPMGEAQTIEFAWDSENLKIYLNDTEVGATSGPYTQPTGQNVYMQLGADINDTNHLNGELMSFKVLREYE